MLEYDFSFLTRSPSVNTQKKKCEKQKSASNVNAIAYIIRKNNQTKPNAV